MTKDYFLKQDEDCKEMLITTNLKKNPKLQFNKVVQI